MKNKGKVFKIVKIFFILLIVLVIICGLALAIVYNVTTTKIQVFLESELTTEQENTIKEQISTICGTNDIEYVSKEDALEQFKEFLGDSSSYILEDYTGENNIFPSSYILKVHFNKQSKFIEEIENINGVSKVVSTKFTTTVQLFFYNLTKKNVEEDNNKQEQYTGLNTTEIKDIIIKNVNNGKIYIDDVGKVISVNSANIKETVDNIELWQVNITYEKSSLSAPIGQSYKGQSYKGTYYFAYNKENEQCFKYMFASDEYSTLKGWSTQGHKDDSSYWIDK
jgi:type II secretory pathway pseudopilin PulG